MNDSPRELINLEQLLATQNGVSDCLFASGEGVSIDKLRHRARLLRKRSENAIGGRIALSGLGSAQLIEAIVAFDGFTQAMLLLPSSFSDSEQEGLMRSAGCTHRVTPDTLAATPLSSCFRGKQRNGQTLWLLATSGTTGTPKLIEHTLTSLSRTAKRDQERGAGYHWGLLYDPCRFAGLQVVLQALLSGARLTLADEGTVQEKMKVLLDYPVNALSATPSLWRRLLMDGRMERLPIRQATLGGEIADQMTLDALRRVFPNARVTHIYASTEAGTGFAVNDDQAGFPADWLVAEQAPIKMRVDVRGHLFVKPTTLPSGQAVSSRLDAEGYLDTEDCVRIEGNRVFFMGRASGTINVGGNKLNPEHIEQILRNVDGVFDVRVYSKRSSLMGQLVAADVMPAVGEDLVILRRRIREHCNGMLESWQRPARMHFVQCLNINSAGKLERRPS